MEKNNNFSEDKNWEVEFYRQAKKKKIPELNDYRDNYTSSNFMSDLVKYFDKEVDFNLVQIQQVIEKPGKLSYLIEKAKEKNTHPVTEFVQELFKDLSS